MLYAIALLVCSWVFVGTGDCPGGVCRPRVARPFGFAPRYQMVPQVVPQMDVMVSPEIDPEIKEVVPEDPTAQPPVTEEAVTVYSYGATVGPFGFFRNRPEVTFTRSRTVSRRAFMPVRRCLRWRR